MTSYATQAFYALSSPGTGTPPSPPGLLLPSLSLGGSHQLVGLVVAAAVLVRALLLGAGIEVG